MSEVTVKELHTLSTADFVSYTNWCVYVRLNYLIAEGFVEIVLDEDDVPTYKCLQPDGTHIILSETEAEDSLLETLLQGIGRYI
jgi:Fe2+ or Zn2+ uptake regulation protein